MSLVGRKFHHLTVLKKLDGKLLCQCDCGKKKKIGTREVIREKNATKSCGCLINKDKITHGKTRHPLYQVWANMKQRCCNPNNPAYDAYGGRGIKMCNAWKNNPKSFFDWAESNGWKPGLDIDRKKNDKGYYPSNCRFVTRIGNLNNTRKNRKVVVNGKEYTLAKAVRKFSNHSYQTVHARLHRYGFSIEEALA